MSPCQPATPALTVWILKSLRMTLLSDRQTDAFDNPAKAACREGNLRVLREAAYLLWEDDPRSRLRCDWCELMGATGLLTLDMLEGEGILAAEGFVGVDLDWVQLRSMAVPSCGLGQLHGFVREGFHPFAFM